MFLNFLQNQQPLVWILLLKAQQEGLIFIDEVTDSISTSNRLLWTYPGLQEILMHMTNNWVEKQECTDVGYKQLLNNLSKGG